ncbi:hypothetical protein FHL15_007167 [Xylaria flabelliformis]|uniref:Uncharacterized protein n=1 Tax=Xylaria flabelliformis TaxID=2512241 RepID=A0A553HV67_9PEZI|nr:hypothetical protein FHL15_007167 [Xylaria flabelliformis]
MRLIDVETLELKEFFNDVPRYAILSHTWGNEEVTFQEYHAAMGPDAQRYTNVKQKAGFLKILGACKRTQADGLQYLWCDTNCIDKSSSAELSEAINTMYAWYYSSAVCYAYLADVNADEPLWTGPGEAKSHSRFENSRWFTRGWTLQELLAPKKVVFFDYAWKVLGDRSGLAEVILRITRINVGALHDRGTVREYSVAQRMSWAADRKTSRQEDIAYCLLGVFDVNMPLLYGEGYKAFERLQLEIIKVSDDQSLFAWDNVSQNVDLCAGALAPSPDGFSACGSIVRDNEIGRVPYSMTNLGISITLRMIQTAEDFVSMVALNCSHELYGHIPRRTAAQNRVRSPIWVFLKDLGDGRYSRCHVPKLVLYHSYPNMVGGSSRTIFFVLRGEPGGNLTSQAEILVAGKNPWLHCSGFRLLLGWGNMNPQHGVFTETRIPGRFYNQTLKSRSPSSLSHELLATKNFSTILSIEWDQLLRPRHWLHTTLRDHEFGIVHQMSGISKWHWLFDTFCWDEDAPARVSTVTKAHELIRNSYKEYLPNHDNTFTPLVLERNVFNDLHGSVELLVDVIIRDIPACLSERNGTKR